MNLSDDALRWMAFQAKRCSDRDCAEAICLASQIVAGYLHLPPMTENEAKEFGQALKLALAEDLKKAA